MYWACFALSNRLCHLFHQRQNTIAEGMHHLSLDVVERSSCRASTIARSWPGPGAGLSLLFPRSPVRLSANANGVATRYEYDVAGRLVTVTKNVSATLAAELSDQRAHRVRLRQVGQSALNGDTLCLTYAGQKTYPFGNRP